MFSRAARVTQAWARRKSPHNMAILLPISKLLLGTWRLMTPRWIRWAVWMSSVISANDLCTCRMSDDFLLLAAFETRRTMSPLVSWDLSWEYTSFLKNDRIHVLVAIWWLRSYTWQLIAMDDQCQWASSNRQLYLIFHRSSNILDWGRTWDTPPLFQRLTRLVSNSSAGMLRCLKQAWANSSLS